MQYTNRRHEDPVAPESATITRPFQIIVIACRMEDWLPVDLIDANVLVRAQHLRQLLDVALITGVDARGVRRDVVDRDKSTRMVE
jgi:hypothetical protein